MRVILRTAVALAFMGLPFGAAAGGEPEAIRWVMGTSLEIVIRHDDPAVVSAARNASFAEAQRLDNLLSPWLDDSPLSRLNAAAGKGPTPADPELVLYLERARLDARRTQGVFDVTVGALVNLYRSGPAEDDAISRALTVTGIRHVSVTLPDLVELPAGLVLDPGGDGKGVAVDAIVRILRERGITSAFVDFGHSTVYGLGDDAGAPWRFAIADVAGRPVGTVGLRDQALSLSAALVSDEPGGPLHGHIVDPRDGRLVTEARHTAVLSPWATDAEVLSTTLVVTGRAGRHLAGGFDQAQVAIFEGDIAPWMTEEFENAFAADRSTAPSD